MKKKQPFSVEQELGAYRVRITENSATLETFKKDWKQVFDVGTNMALHIISHFQNKAWAELEMLAYALYTGSILTVLDAPFINGLGKLFEEYSERQLAKAAETPETEETEEEILQQEKYKQEFKEQLLNETKQD